MSDAKSRGSDKTQKRNLPSWMSYRGNASKTHGKKAADVDIGGDDIESEQPKQARGHAGTDIGSSHSMEIESSEKGVETSMGTLNFSKLLEGGVFVLSGFVNPERGKLRSQALEMGAEYQPDWNSDCTLLICAFPNTPKFRQVEAECGTIVSKEWISECYNQKKLVPIESYLMHAGKPWRKSSFCYEASEVLADQKTSPPKKPHKHVEKRSCPKPSASTSSKNKAPNLVKDCLSPSRVKKWAIDDLNKTISWLESQDESPEPSEVKKIAMEGILTCLQDAIESLEKRQDIRKVTEQWKFVPRVVEELARLEDQSSCQRPLSKEDICQQAMICRQIYELEFACLEGSSPVKRKRPKTGEDGGDKDGNVKSEIKSSDAAYDSDETIEMTEEEIDLAYKIIASKVHKWYVNLLPFNHAEATKLQV